MAGIQGFSAADRFELVKRYAPDEFAPGRDVLGEFGHLARIDSQGRHKALAGFVIRAKMRMGAGQNGGNTAAKRDLLGFFQNFRMRALGVSLFEGDLDARHLQHDVQLRLGRDAPDFCLFDAGGVPGPNEGYEVGIFYPFGNPWAAGSRKNDCNIPLAALDHRKDPTSKLQFRVGPTLPFDNDGQPVIESLELWALTRAELQPLLVALPRLIEVRQTQLGETLERSSLDRDARVEYAVIRHLREDASDNSNGPAVVMGYEGLSVRHGQDQWLVAEDAESARGALMGHYPAPDLMAGGPEGAALTCLPIVAPRPRADISDGAAYPIHWQIQSRDGAPFTRVLRRERITLRTVEQQAMAVLQDVDPTQAVPETKASAFEASTITPAFVTRRIKLLSPAPAAPAPRRGSRARPR